jgi:hypothetical protein
MSDFDEAVLPTPDPEPDPVPEPEPTPEPTPEPDPIWKKAGFDTEEAMVKKLSGLSEWEKDLQRKSSTLGAQEKHAPAPVVDDDDPFAGLDPASAKMLERAIDKRASKLIDSRVGVQTRVAAELFNDNAEKLLNQAAEANGLDPDDLHRFMADNELLPTEPSLKQLASKLELAVAAKKGQTIDDIVEQRLADKMAELKKEGAEVRSVDPVTKKEPEGAEESFKPTSFLDNLKRFSKGD